MFQTSSGNDTVTQTPGVHVSGMTPALMTPFSSSSSSSPSSSSFLVVYWSPLGGGGASSLFRWCRHLEDAVLVKAEQTPALLLGQVFGAAALVELDGRSVGRGHDEMHAAAAGLHRSLENAHTTTHL